MFENMNETKLNENQLKVLMCLTQFWAVNPQYSFGELTKSLHNEYIKQTREFWFRESPHMIPDEDFGEFLEKFTTGGYSQEKEKWL